MPIVFHCEHCGKKIEAPDNAGGRRGKCPGCHNRVYVPASEQADESLHVAPLDEDEEARRRRMISESYNITEKVLDAKSVPEIPTEELPAPEMGLGFIPLPPVSDADLTRQIVRFLTLTAEGQLDQAAEQAEAVVAQGPRTERILEQIALNQITDPELAKIPPQILNGLIRNLRTQLR